MKVYTCIILTIGFLICFLNPLVAQDETLTVLNPTPFIQDELEFYASEFTEDTGIKVEIVEPGANESYNETLEKMIISGNAPDIFAINNHQDFVKYSSVLEPLTTEKWVDETNFEYTSPKNNEVYGFPLLMNVHGLYYNKEMMNFVQFDPNSVTSIDDLSNMFNQFNTHKQQLNIVEVLAISLEDYEKQFMVTVNYLFDALLQNEISNSSTDPYQYYSRLTSELFLDSYSAPESIPYETQISDFKFGKTAFIYGDLAIPYLLAQSGYDMNNLGIMGLPTSSNEQKFVIGVDSFFVVNNKGDVDEAKLFLNNLTTTSYGSSYYYSNAYVVSPFSSCKENATFKIHEEICQAISTENFIPTYTNLFSSETLKSAYEKPMHYYYNWQVTSNFTDAIKTNTTEIISPYLEEYNHE